MTPPLRQVCPTCGLASAADLAHAFGLARGALARLEKAPGALTREQRVNLKLATACVLGLEVLFLEEAARRREQESSCP